MALVKVIHVTEGLGKGGTVRIFDDDYAGISAEELRRRRDAIALEIWKIDQEHQRKLMEMRARERCGAAGGPGGGPAAGNGD